MHILSDIQQIDLQRWNALLEHSSYASPFQTPEFYDFYNTVNGYAADVFAVEDKGQYLALVVVTLQHEKGVKAYFSRRGIVYGGIVLLEHQESEATNLLLSHLKRVYSRKLIYLELRNNFDYTVVKELILNSGFDYVPWLNIQFDKVNAKDFREGMTKSRQRQFNKAIRNGAEWREATSIVDVRAFYRILSHLYKHKVKKPLPSLEFFEKFYFSTIAKCLVVVKDDVVIGGVMCPVYLSGSLYEFYICGMDKSYPNAHPSIMAMWAMVEYADKNNIGSIDLMGAGQPNKSSSVREFKSKFGGKIVENGRFILICKPFLYTLGRIYLLFNKKCSFL